MLSNTKPPKSPKIGGLLNIFLPDELGVGGLFIFLISNAKISTVLNLWSEETGLGETTSGAGIIFSDADNVIPDVLWISKERLAAGLDDAGHLTVAPELVIEVLSPGEVNERRDKEVKLKLYASQGVREYWIANWQLQQIQVYRREQAMLVLVGTLFAGDEVTSPF